MLFGRLRKLPQKSWEERGEGLGWESCLSFEKWRVFVFPLRQEGSEGAQSSLRNKKIN